MAAYNFIETSDFFSKGAVFNTLANFHLRKIKYLIYLNHVSFRFASTWSTFNHLADRIDLTKNNTEFEYEFISLPHTLSTPPKYSFGSINSVYNIIFKAIKSCTREKTLRICNLHNNYEAAGPT